MTTLDNLDHPFSELFSLLEAREVKNGGINLAYTTETMKAIHQHSENAIALLLSGIQSIGYLMSVKGNNKFITGDNLNDLGFLIATLSDLTDAIYTLNSNVAHQLKHKGNYL